VIQLTIVTGFSTEIMDRVTEILPIVFDGISAAALIAATYRFATAGGTLSASAVTPFTALGVTLAGATGLTIGGVGARSAA